MALYRRILVPTDGSREGRVAIEHAIELASVHDAELHGLYVVNTASYAGLPMESSWEGVDEMLRADAEDAIEAVEAVAEDSAVAVETEIVDGTPSERIIRYAETNDCDLIVMATRGRGGIDRLLLGSVTEKVVRGSSVPVLTINVGEGDHSKEDSDRSDRSQSVGDSDRSDANEHPDADSERPAERQG